MATGDSPRPGAKLERLKFVFSGGVRRASHYLPFSTGVCPSDLGGI